MDYPFYYGIDTGTASTFDVELDLDDDAFFLLDYMTACVLNNGPTNLNRQAPLFPTLRVRDFTTGRDWWDGIIPAALWAGSAYFDCSRWGYVMGPGSRLRFQGTNLTDGRAGVFESQIGLVGAKISLEKGKVSDFTPYTYVVGFPQSLVGLFTNTIGQRTTLQLRDDGPFELQQLLFFRSNQEAATFFTSDGFGYLKIRVVKPVSRELVNIPIRPSNLAGSVRCGFDIEPVTFPPGALVEVTYTGNDSDIGTNIRLGLRGKIYA